MKKTTRSSWLTIILIILVIGNTFAQLSDRDRLLEQIPKENNDTNRIKLLIQLGLNYAENDSLAIIYLKEAHDLSVKNKYRPGLAYGQYYEVLKLWLEGSIDEAIDKDKQCIEAIDSLHLVVGSPLVNIRFLYNIALRQEEKFQFYSEKAAYYKRYGPMENLAVCYHGIAGYYWYLGDHDRAIENYMHARDILKPIDPAAFAGETMFIGSMYLDWGNLDKAEEFLKSGRKDLIRLNIPTNGFYYYHKLGEVNLKKHDHRQALSWEFNSRYTLA